MIELATRTRQDDGTSSAGSDFLSNLKGHLPDRQDLFERYREHYQKSGICEFHKSVGEWNRK